VKRGQVPSTGELVAFVSAAQHGSFTRAANELNLTQGAVSRQIRQLEQQLGVTLFERVRQRIILTDVGKLYLDRVQKALDELAAATRQVVTFGDGNSIINLAVLPAFGARWLIPRLPDFQEKYPDIVVHLTTRKRPVDFAVEPFDAAISHGSPIRPGTVAHHLMDDDMLPVCSPRLRDREPIHVPADLASFPLLHQTSRPTRWAEWMVQAGADVKGPLPGPIYENSAMIARAAVAGLGIALLPRFLVEEELATQRLVVLFDTFLHAKASYFLIIPEARASSRAIRLFADWLIAEAQ